MSIIPANEARPHTSTETIPFRDDSDRNEFGILPDLARQDVRRRFRAVASVIETRGKSRKVIAATAAHHAAQLGLKLKTLRNLVTAYAGSSADWRTLLDTARWRIGDGTFLLPPAFITEWKRRVERHHGGIKAAHAELLEDWRAWRRSPDSAKAIPGYEIAPEPRGATNIPAGWSYQNLVLHAPSRAEMAIMRRGLGSARSMLPQILTSRTELLVAQRWEFDDYEPNLVVLAGHGTHRGKAKPLQLAALDVHSGCVPLARHKHTWLREDGTCDKWKLAHMRLFVAALLYQFGYDTQTGTALVLEGGTATLDKETVQLIHDLTDKKVRCEFPPDAKRKQVAPFKGESGGNPNKKPHIESWHNLLTNRLGNLAGQKGSNYLSKPEYLAGIEAAEHKALKQAEQLIRDGRPDRAALIVHELLDFQTEFLPEITLTIARINESREHDLEGWEALGYVVSAYRLHAESEEWISRTEFPLLADGGAELMRLANLAPATYSRQLRLSRREVFTGQMREGLASGRIRRLSGWEACELIAADKQSAELVNAIRPRNLKGAYFTVEDSRLALLPGPQIYEARVERPDGSVTELPEDTYQLIFNAFSPDTIFVRDAKGCFIGIARRADRLNPNDTRAILEACGAKGHRIAERLDPLRERHADWGKEVKGRANHNARVVAGAAITPEEKARHRRIAKDVRSVTAADLADITTAPAELPGETTSADAQSDALNDLI